MVECRHCRGYFRAQPEKIGARCPKCRMPLFERPDKQTPGADLGACATHPGVLAVLACQRCGKNVCAACRTKWHGEQLCPSCVELSLSRAEPNPRELRKQGGRAVWSLTLAILGVLVALLALTILVTRGQTASVAWPIIFSLLSLVPALFAIGQGCPVLLSRGPSFRVAASGIILAGSHLGLLLGVFLLNVWHN
ncbi:MAG: hypothetical protein L0Y71_18845 [Gemmataceae bacterium]|nr:hypothetical protein [Gemmataceae bacterium]